MRSPFPVFALSVAAFALTGCCYHTLDAAKALPESIHTIAVTPWANATIQYKLSERITAAISRELISRTHYTIIADPAKADAVLSGSVVNVLSNATVNDPVLNRSTAGQVTAYLQVKLIAKDGKVLFNRPNIELRERYEIATTPGQYFDESAVALDRLSQDAARTVVSAILENF